MDCTSFALAKDKAKSEGVLKGIYKKLQQREKTKEYMLKTLDPVSVAYQRYTNRHIVIENYKTYPMGIFPDLASFDFRGDKHRCSVQLNQENDGDDYGYDIPLNIYEPSEQVYDL